MMKRLAVLGRWPCGRPRPPCAGTADQPASRWSSALAIFVLACFVGYYVVWSVTPALHTPLMAVTNAISSVIIVGALIAAAGHGPEMTFGSGSPRAWAPSPSRWPRQHLRRLPRHPAACSPCTRRKKTPKRCQGGHSSMNANLAAIPLSRRLVCSSWRCAGSPAPPPAGRQPLRHDRHGHRGRHHLWPWESVPASMP
jgi:hypothetical protein